MNREDEYQAWIAQRKQVQMNSEFPKSLMSEVYQFEQRRRKIRFDSERFFAWLSTRRLAKAGIVAAAAAIGLTRFLVIICVVFGSR